MLFEKLEEIIHLLKPVKDAVPVQHGEQKPIDAFRFRTQGQIRHVLEMQSRKKARER